jgi:hypothetical protein
MAAMQASPVAAAPVPSSIAEPGREQGGRFEAVRLGDGALTCEALIAEISGLNGQLQDMQQQMTQASTQMSRSAMQAAQRRPAALGMGVAGLASFVPGAAYLAGAAQAAGALSAQASARNQQTQMLAQMEAITASSENMAPIAERVAHLSQISRTKSC